jgi:tellurite resistance protein
MEQSKAILEVFRASDISAARRLINNDLPRKIDGIDHKCRGDYADNDLTEEETVLYTIVKKIGLSPKVVYTSLKLLSIPESMQIKATERGIDKDQLSSIATVKIEQDQQEVFDVVVEKELSSRETAALTKVVNKAPEPIKRAVLDAKVSVEVAQTIIDAKLPDKEQEKIVHIAVDQHLSKEGTKKIATIVKTSPESVKRAVLDVKVSPEVAQTIVEIERPDDEQEALVNVAIKQKLSKEAVKHIAVVVDTAPEPVKHSVMVGTLSPEMGEEITVAFADLPDEATEQVTKEVVDMVHNERTESYIIEHIDNRKHDAECLADPNRFDPLPDRKISRHEMHANNIVDRCKILININPSFIKAMPQIHKEKSVSAILEAHKRLGFYLQLMHKDGLLSDGDIDKHKADCAMALTEGITIPDVETADVGDEIIDTEYTEM